MQQKAGPPRPAFFVMTKRQEHSAARCYRFRPLRRSTFFILFLVIGCKVAERVWLKNKDWAHGPDDHEASFSKTSGQSRSIRRCGRVNAGRFCYDLEDLDVENTAKVVGCSVGNKQGLES